MCSEVYQYLGAWIVLCALMEMGAAPEPLGPRGGIVDGGEGRQPGSAEANPERQRSTGGGRNVGHGPEQADTVVGWDVRF